MEIKLRDIQLHSLEILKYLDDVCDSQGLDYFIMYGTLIGAVRHEGFIPWDDDIDIMMPRKDYEALLSFFENCETKDFKLLNYRNSQNYPYMISRVSDCRFKLEVQNEANFGLGVFVDVYPLDDISNSLLFALFKGRVHGILSSLYFASTRLNPPKFISIKDLLKVVHFFVAKVVGKRFLGLLLDKSKLDTNNPKKYVGCLQWMTSDSDRNVIKRTLIEGRTRLMFEGVEVNAPLNYDRILSDYYGNYMRLPPKKERVPHHLYKAFRK